jgi:hypothetical protein
MHEVEAHRSTNEQVRKKFLNVPDIIDVIHCRQLTWIAKVARMGMGEERAPRRLIQTLWWDKPRKEGRPQCTCQNSYAEAIAKVIPSLPQDARLQQWFPSQKRPLPSGGRRSLTTHSKPPNCLPMNGSPPQMFLTAR